MILVIKALIERNKLFLYVSGEVFINLKFQEDLSALALAKGSRCGRR